MRARLSLCLLPILTACASAPSLPPEVCPTVPQHLLAPTEPPALPATYGELRDYALALQEALARCNGDKADALRALR